MSYTIALAGKGGTGKTTIAALLARMLKEKKMGSVLAVDADPNSNLAEALGMKAEASIGSILEDISAHPQRIPPGTAKETFVEYQVHAALSETDGIDCLTMGRPEGPGCYCYVNNVLRNMMTRLSRDYDYVVIDNEAGFEHLSRRTSRKIDVLLVVSDASIAGLKAAQRISELARELKIEVKKTGLIVNCANFSADKAKSLKLDYLGSLPLEPEVESISRNGGSLMALSSQSVFLRGLYQLGEKICQSN